MSNARSYILLVEDNEDDVELTRHALGRFARGEQLVVARDGAEALELLWRQAEAAALPQVVLLDINLPRLSGLQVLERMRADERTVVVPVVMLTTSSLERDVESSYRLGANSYVRKPVDSEEFRETIHRLGRYWLGVNTPPPEPKPASTGG